MIERLLERVIFASRWIMAPLYLGLILVLLMLSLKFAQELVGFVPKFWAMKDTEVILAALTLIDITLAGSLVLMVIFSGYENFVSKIETDEGVHRPEWMGTLDFSGLKLKLIASIVAISGIHLLKSFMNVTSTDKDTMFWLVIIHMAFVSSGVLLALMDWITAQTKH